MRPFATPRGGEDPKRGFRSARSGFARTAARGRAGNARLGNVVPRGRTPGGEDRRRGAPRVTRGVGTPIAINRNVLTVSTVGSQAAAAAIAVAAAMEGMS